MQTEEQGTWGIELKGAEVDLAAWRMMLKSPFDPFIQEINDERGIYLVLCSSKFQTLSTSSEVHAAAKTLLKILNPIMSTNADSDHVSAGAAVEFRADGPPRKHHVVEVEPISMRVRVGLATITLSDADGKVIEPKPAPSVLRNGCALQRSCLILEPRCVTWKVSPVGSSSTRLTRQFKECQMAASRRTR